MNGMFLEIQPTSNGDEISWWNYHFNRFKLASSLESKFGFTVQLTNAISTILRISKTIDPSCNALFENRKGFLCPNFSLYINSKKFEVLAKKIFAGGSSRDRVFNYKVNVLVNSNSPEIMKLFQKSYHELGPIPLKENVVFEENHR
jgi:hypothetical protein